MTFNGVKEADSSLRCAVELANASPAKVAQVAGTFSRTVTELNRIQITVEITF
jgi:hypothetical protein